ncbi:MAG: T9SS type A sorting domain-containing protein [Gemmatimonadetes bacterium]|nr:T9SS type A sorting domain-containing protein [Gemmatimonadota bacterium]
MSRASPAPHAVRRLAASRLAVFAGTIALLVAASSLSFADFSADDEAWRIFGPPTPTDDRVVTLFVYQNELLAGGEFDHITGFDVAKLGRWEGSCWRSLGDVPDQRVHAMALYGGNLMIGGDFSTIGSDTIGNVAEWNGVSWAPLGPGMAGGFPDRVRAFEEYAGELVVGGDFNQVDGKNANGIARWNGTRWRRYGSGFGPDGICGALTVFDGYLVAGGDFDTAGMASVDNVAKWDTISGTGWSRLGTSTMSELNDRVTDLRIYDGDLYACGRFTNTISGISVNHIARWQPVGLKWEDVGGGVNGDLNFMHVFAGELWVGGDFDTAGTVAAHNVARWNGTAWAPAGAGIPAVVESFADRNNELYAATESDTGAPGYTDAVLRWDGAAWNALRTEPGPAGIKNGSVFALAETNGDLVIGGTFTNVGDSALAYVARLENDQWEPMGAGLNGFVHGFTTFDTDLVAVGSFTSSAGTDLDRVARWDGAVWEPFGSGVNGIVFAAAEHDSDLYVGGDFSIAGVVPASNIARWSGSWSDVGGGTDGRVWALAGFGGDLVAAGSFSLAGAVPVANVARWDGAAWHPLGGGLPGGNGVVALLADGPDLYAGGYFSTAMGAPANYVARWDGANWNALGTGLSFAVLDFAYQSGRLYATGSFTLAGGDTVNASAWWDGTEWHALGSGIELTGNAVLAAAGGDVYFGGGFQRAGGRVSLRLASWSGAIATTVAEGTRHAPGAIRLIRSAFPNPFNPSVTIRYELPATGPTRLSIHDVRGRLVRILFEGNVRAGEGRAIWDGAGISGAAPSGVYFAVIEAGSAREAGKLILVR